MLSEKDLRNQTKADEAKNGILRKHTVKETEH